MKKKKLPTELEIKAEVDKLKKMKPSVRLCSKFGDNHHDAIDAQISVLEDSLEDSLDDGEIYDRYEEGPENVLDSALGAMHWAEGDDDVPPSKNWESLVKK